MSFDLESASGTRLNVSGSGWAFVLNLAEAYGWRPMGTRPPNGISADSWDGRYDSSDGQIVLESDAQALGDALHRAMADPNMLAVANRVAEVSKKHIRDEFLRLTGSALSEADSDDVLIDPDGVRAVMLLCSQGRFSID